MIAIVITSYNREKFLRRAIESVLAQSHRDFKLLIWDDSSSDFSLEIAKSYLPSDSRVEVCAGIHSGASESLKKAIENAIALYNPKYIAWVDSDDYLHPQALELMLPVMEACPNLGVIYSDYMAVDERGNELGISRSATIPYSKDRLLVDLMCHHFQIIRRTAYKTVGGIDTSFTYNHDYDLMLKLSEITHFSHFPQVLYYRRMHENSITGSQRNEQIAYSRTAIEKAIARRGMSNSSFLNVDDKTGLITLTLWNGNSSERISP